MLLATTSSCRSSTVCRDRPMRSAFSTVFSPEDDPLTALPGRWRMLANLGSPKPRFAEYSAKAVPVWKIVISEWVIFLGGLETVGRKVLLTMFARQFFPTADANETFR